MKVSQEMTVRERLGVLLNALRDGSYQQRGGALRVTGNTGETKGFCCEGVACDLTVGILGEWETTWDDDSKFLGQASYAPAVVSEFFGIEQGTSWADGTEKWIMREPVTSAVDDSVLYWRDVFPAVLNDNGSSFEQIADRLEAYYLNGGKEQYEAWIAAQD
jgi:hypothetical protein